MLIGFSFLAQTTTTDLASILVSDGTNLTWALILMVYLLLVIGTAIPMTRAFMANIGKISLVVNDADFDASTLKPEELRQVKKNFEMMKGTLKYWKKQARQTKLFHFYAVIWTTLGTILVPLLLPMYQQSPYVNTLVQIVSVHTAVLLAFHRLFKPDNGHQEWRKVESAYYDLLRDMLDRPYLIDRDETKRLDVYIEKVKQLRAEGRRVEFAQGFPVLDTAAAAQAVQQVAAPIGGQALQAASQSVTVAHEQQVQRAQAAALQMPSQSIYLNSQPTGAAAAAPAPVYEAAEEVYTATSTTTYTTTTTPGYSSAPPVDAAAYSPAGAGAAPVTDTGYSPAGGSSYSPTGEASPMGETSPAGSTDSTDPLQRPTEGSP
ncbi:MAG: hypothetical protein SF162_18145 [bacterium]|nr:hypothetical protein [bacterium]